MCGSARSDGGRGEARRGSDRGWERGGGQSSLELRLWQERLGGGLQGLKINTS